MTRIDAYLVAVALAMAVIGTAAHAQSAAAVLGPASVVPLDAPQPPAKLIVDPPLPGPLAEGKVFIQYVPRTCGSRRCSARRHSPSPRASATSTSW